MEDAPFKLRVYIAIKRHTAIENIKSESTVSKETVLSGVKLPKVSVPTFDGEVLNWRSFWEQFDATIHCKTELSNTEKLTYSTYKSEAFKDGPAKFVISGLTRTPESYGEVIKCVKKR